MSNKKVLISKNDIDIAWNKYMVNSHSNPGMSEFYKRKNKYHKNKLRIEKLIVLLGL